MVEEKLGIPVIHVELPGGFAGATLSNENFRGIVINMNGRNANVWVRRMTMAHEFGHFLWDPGARLKRLLVDRYREIETDFETSNDAVEQRANAFAVEFLAPQDAILKIYTTGSNRDEALAQIIQAYGISPTATGYHLSNRLHGAKVDARHIRMEPDGGLMGREELSVSFFKPGIVPISRRGRFAVLVGRAESRHLISTDTAASLLACPPTMIEEALAHIRSLESPGTS
jgi:Zn-dependent peptidase ImmA (M78 family)